MWRGGGGGLSGLTRAEIHKTMASSQTEILHQTQPYIFALKILLLSDLHFNKAWYDWVESVAPSYQMVALSGDLLDGRSEEGLMTQMLWLREWIGKAPSQLAISSGNHDANEPNLSLEPSVLEGLPPEGREVARQSLMADRWMDILDTPKVHTDNRSQVVSTSQGKLVVSTIPHDDLEGTEHEELWTLGYRLRAAHRCPWIVLHHDPPHGTVVGGHGGSPVLRRQILVHQPDYVLSGHLHHQPYLGGFAERLKATWCFNPGASKTPPLGHPTPPVPNHIVLDIKEGCAQWYATWQDEPTPRISRKALA